MAEKKSYTLFKQLIVMCSIVKALERNNSEVRILISDHMPNIGDLYVVAHSKLPDPMYYLMWTTRWIQNDNNTTDGLIRNKVLLFLKS